MYRGHTSLEPRMQEQWYVNIYTTYYSVFEDTEVFSNLHTLLMYPNLRGHG